MTKEPKDLNLFELKDAIGGTVHIGGTRAPEGTVYQTEDGYYVLQGRFGGIGINGPEPTAEEREALERHEYPYGRDIFFVPITRDGETWQQDLPAFCIELAERTGISNELIAQHFVDISQGHFRELLPLCSDREARGKQIWTIADRILWSACGSCPEMDLVGYRRHVECPRGGEAVSGVTTDEVALFFEGPSEVIPFSIPTDAAGKKMLREQLSVVYLNPEKYKSHPKPVPADADEAEREIAEQLEHQEWMARFDQYQRRYGILSNAIDPGLPWDDDDWGPRPPSPAPAEA
jgi:hypothetical protein